MLRRLGEIAEENRARWVDLHFTETPKNKPDRVLRDGIGASLKQAQNGGYLFRFPARVAAEMRLRPQNETPAKRASIEVSAMRAHEIAEEEAAQGWRRVPVLNAASGGESVPRFDPEPAAEPVPIYSRPAVPQEFAPKFNRCRAIALEADDPAKIHSRIEAKTAARPRKRTGFVAPRTSIDRQRFELLQHL